MVGQAVAVLYADEGSEDSRTASWPETVEILGVMRRRLGAPGPYRQAARTAHPPRLRGGGTRRPMAVQRGSDEESMAHAATRVCSCRRSSCTTKPPSVLGRERRDLLTRLGAEIARAQRLYEERVPPSIGARSQYFQQELVQTLADGDPGLLGNGQVTDDQSSCCLCARPGPRSGHSQQLCARQASTRADRSSCAANNRE